MAAGDWSRCVFVCARALCAASPSVGVWGGMKCVFFFAGSLGRGGPGAGGGRRRGFLAAGTRMGVRSCFRRGEGGSQGRALSEGSFQDKATASQPPKKDNKRPESNILLTRGGGGKHGRRAAHGQRGQLGLAQVLVVGEQVVDDGVDVGAADGAEQLEVGRGLWCEFVAVGLWMFCRGS